MFRKFPTVGVGFEAEFLSMGSSYLIDILLVLYCISFTSAFKCPDVIITVH